MKLLNQPDTGVEPLVEAIDAAKTSIEILIFRFDHAEIEKALGSAVERGVEVKALIAHVNGSGGERLRRLESRLLKAGVTVARTANEFPRYHAKFLIVDHRELFLLAFNFTKQDIAHSRSFGVVVKDGPVVQEALSLFEADMTRQPYEPGLKTFIVSPSNARKQLAAFIEGAKKELLIYDPKISDIAMIRLLEDRARKGVTVRIIGELSPVSELLTVRQLSRLRLHTRTMVRDGEAAFVGSQSLRQMELDRRREAGIIFEDSTTINQLVKIFQQDWDASEHAPSENARPSRVAKRVAKAVSKDLPPIAPVLAVTIKELGGERLTVDKEAVEKAVRDAVKDAVKEAVTDVVEQAAQKG